MKDERSDERHEFLRVRLSVNLQEGVFYLIIYVEVKITIGTDILVVWNESCYGEQLLRVKAKR
ncbi:hypothetical protein M3197_14610 [Sporosarcina aquimarina]|uniref:hypothetical protein n=1 Tax=Sporosarcina aquimarina TaxID=114975 RepID=UPI00203E729D|nr:hypothetical protein [Sporosarcina aquimarina]MCM3758694.1 hypothetical protein [Sporosarcina aquimarina]